MVHACNTAGAIARPGTRYDMVRVGIGIYGLAPSPALAGVLDLVPALSVKARVSHVQTLPAGARLSYGLRYETARPARVATVPIGYADGVPRELAHHGGEVLIGGRRHPIAGTVTMDQFMVDVGDDAVEVGDEVVLIGRQGDEQITRRRVGRADAHDRVHDRVRCRPACSAEIPLSLVKRAGIAAGTLTGAAGLAYGAQRAVARRMRRVPDGDAQRALDAPTYVDHRLETHDRGTIYVVERGDELDPPIVLSHGVTLSVRTWFHQLEDLPKEGFRTIAFDHRGHGRSVLGTEGHSLDNLGRDFKTVLEQLDLRGAVLVGHSMGGVAVQSFVTQFPEVAAERVAGIVLLSTLAYTPFGSRSTRTKARLEKILKHSPDAQWIWDSPNLGFLAARVGFGEHPRPSHVELVRKMMGECPPETRRDAPARPRRSRPDPRRCRRSGSRRS